MTENLRKKCTQSDCDRAGQWLPIDEFYMVKHTLADGSIKRYPSGACKRCRRAYVQRWRQKFKDEKGLDAYRELCRRYNKPYSERRKRYNREYARRKSGKHGPTWKIYRHEVSVGDHVRIPAEPFREWWRNLPEPERSEIRASNSSLARAIHRITTTEQKTMKITILDQVGDALGDPGLRHRLAD